MVAMKDTSEAPLIGVYDRQDNLVGFKKRGTVLDYEGVGRSELGLYNVFSKCMHATNSNGVNTRIMTASPHTCFERTTKLLIGWGNWYASSNNTGELNNGGTMTLTAGIEYPVGTLHAVVKFSGSVAASVAAGASVFTTVDVDLPEGAQVVVRSLQVNPNGIIFTDEKASANFLLSATFGTTAGAVPDLTQSTATPTNTQAGIGFFPLVVAAVTRKRSVGILGDSNLFGLNDTPDDWSIGRGAVERSIGKRMPVIRLGATGEQLNALIDRSGASPVFSNKFTRRVELVQYFNEAICLYGTNDLSNGRTDAQLRADILTFESLLGKTTRWCTLPPKVTTSNNYQDAAGQTPVAAFQTQRATFNPWLRSKWGTIDISSELEDPADSTKWISNGTANYATSDGTHLSQAICRKLEMSNRFRSFLQAPV